MRHPHHQDLVVVFFWLVSVEKPELTGNGACVEEVGTNSNHEIHVASFHKFLPHFGLVASGAGCLRRHDEAGSALFVEVADLDVVSVGDLAFLVNAVQAKW